MNTKAKAAESTEANEPAKRIPALSIDVVMNTNNPTDPNNGLMVSFNGGKPEPFMINDLVSGDDNDNDVLAYALLHGLKQKLVDSAAIARDPETGASATPKTKEAAVRSMMARLREGRWNVGRGEGTSTGGLLFRALVKMYDGKKSPETIATYLATLDKKAQAALRRNPKVSTIIAEIQAAETDLVETDRMLDGLENMED